MEKLTFRCCYCKCITRKNLRIKKQRYCGKPACQRARKRRWEREKLKNDPDYRANKHESQKIWRQQHLDYDRNYRQRKINSSPHTTTPSVTHRQCSYSTPPESNTKPFFFFDPSITYRIIPIGYNYSKKDAIEVKIIVTSENYNSYTRRTQ